jgi:ABC-type antimicrobial peptide transport system permease subunit
MLRAIGLSVFDIRLMIFLEVLVRIVVSIAMGIVLGIIFSLGLSGQIEEILMLKAPMPDLSLVLEIAGALLIVFSLTVVKSTHYLTKRTVS